jgi:hypothetical protein
MVSLSNDEYQPFQKKDFSELQVGLPAQALQGRQRVMLSWIYWIEGCHTTRG